VVVLYFLHAVKKKQAILINNKFIIKNAPFGKQTIQFSSVGYKNKQLIINVIEEKTIILNIEMTLNFCGLIV
jgi:hypothetical protein